MLLLFYIYPFLAIVQVLGACIRLYVSKSNKQKARLKRYLIAVVMYAVIAFVILQMISVQNPIIDKNLMEGFYLLYLSIVPVFYIFYHLITIFKKYDDVGAGFGLGDSDDVLA